MRTGTAANPGTRRWRELAPVLLIVTCGLAVYEGSLGGVFVFDDLPWIVENQSIRKLWPPWAAMGITLRPLLFYSFAINYAISGLDVWSYHVVNLAIHVSAALALYGLVRRILLTDRLVERYGSSARWIALVVALIWMVHPLQSQAVAYVIQRGESLMGLFFLLTLYCVVRGAQSPHPRPWYVVAVFVHLCGLGTKEVMATCLPVLFILDALFVCGSVRGAIRRRWVLYCVMAAPGVIALVAVLYFRIYIDSALPASHTYALTQSGVILHYLRLSFWPDPLCFDYAWPLASSWKEAYLSVTAVGLLVLGSLWALFRRRAVGFLGAAFFLVLAPTSSFMPVRDPALEHRMYLPLAAVAVLVVLAGHQALRRLPAREHTRALLAPVMVGILVAAGGFRTHQRIGLYRSAEAIWADVIAQRPENARAHNSLGASQAARGDFERAAASYREAIRLRPDYPEAHNNLGVAALHSGQLDSALASCREALRLRPNYAHAHINLGMVLIRQGKTGAAQASYLEAVRLAPDFAGGHNNLGTTWEKLDKLEEAAACYLRATELDDRYALAFFNLANVVLKQGRSEEAIAHYRTSLRLEPNFPEACNNLGLALLTVGRREEAEVQFREALRLRPDYAEAQESLSRSL